MKTSALLLSMLLVLAPAAASAQQDVHGAHAHAPAAKAKASPAPKLQAALRGLWLGHVNATRDYALAVQNADGKKAQRAEQAVVSNAKQISGAVAGFYGKPAGDKLLTLLAGHWGAVKAMTDAEKAKDKPAQARAIETLTSNAREISEFLAGANPHLPKDAVFGLLAAHGGHHASQITQIMARDMKAESTTRKAMETHMNAIADALAQAIAKQFPKKAA